MCRVGTACVPTSREGKALLPRCIGGTGRKRDEEERLRPPEGRSPMECGPAPRRPRRPGSLPYALCGVSQPDGPGRAASLEGRPRQRTEFERRDPAPPGGLRRAKSGRRVARRRGRRCPAQGGGEGMIPSAWAVAAAGVSTPRSPPSPNSENPYRILPRYTHNRRQHLIRQAPPSLVDNRTGNCRYCQASPAEDWKVYGLIIRPHGCGFMAGMHADPSMVSYWRRRGSPWRGDIRAEPEENVSSQDAQFVLRT